MCVEKLGLIPAQMLGGIPAAAALRSNSCSLGSCNVQPRPDSPGWQLCMSLRLSAPSKVKALWKEWLKYKENSRKSPQFQELLFGHPVVWNQTAVFLRYVVSRREVERQFGFRFQREAKQDWRYCLQFSFPLLSCFNFPTLPPPPWVSITCPPWEWIHFLLVIGISDIHMLRWGLMYLGIKITPKAHLIVNLFFFNTCLFLAAVGHNCGTQVQ